MLRLCSLRNYKRTTTAQKRKISEVIQGSIDGNNNSPTAKCTNSNSAGNVQVTVNVTKSTCDVNLLSKLSIIFKEWRVMNNGERGGARV
jgi:hypothetical protein